VTKSHSYFIPLSFADAAIKLLKKVEGKRFYCVSEGDQFGDNDTLCTFTPTQSSPVNESKKTSQNVKSVKYFKFRKAPKHPRLYSLCLAISLLPLLALSLAPHQEFRFLLPLLLPVSICSYLFGFRLFYSASAPPRAGNRALRIIWIVWNVVFCIVFGAAHQAHVTTASSQVRSHFLLFH
jgi:hypothetical protein